MKGSASRVSPNDHPSPLAAILAADVAAYSAMMEREEEGTLGAEFASPVESVLAGTLWAIEARRRIGSPLRSRT
jgi:hypothetical protein